MTLIVTNHGSESAVRRNHIIRTGSNINGSLTSLVKIMITFADGDFKNCVFISLNESFRGTLLGHYYHDFHITIERILCPANLF